jgi:RNA polymerase sigma factor (sigma-70 family)
MDDAQLLTAFVDLGDAGAYSELIRRHQIRIFRLLLSMLGSPGDAEAACEEVFVRAAQRIDPQAPPGNFAAWLVQLAQRIVEERSEPRARIEPPSPRAQPRSALRHAVLDIMDGLPAEERTVLVLVELQHDTPDAIAAALGMTRGEVEAKLVSARARFQAAFDERCAAAEATEPPSPAAPSPDPGPRLASQLAAGDTLAGRFRIESLLDEGGMAVVYRATDLETERPVAIKALLPETAGSHPLRARLRREADALARVSHPHVVELVTTGTDPDGSVYLVMEFVDGPTLSSELDRGPMSMRRALAVFDQVLDGLGALHDAAVIHRDLKPENIKLKTTAPGFTTKILDLGIARLTDETLAVTKLTSTGLAIGTPAYMPPEQAMGRDVDPPGDLYAATILLFEMITGKLPFHSNDLSTLLLMQVSTPPPLPSEVDPEREYSEQLEDLLLQGLAKDPEDRPATAAAYREAIRTCPEWRTVRTP